MEAGAQDTIDVSHQDTIAVSHMFRSKRSSHFLSLFSLIKTRTALVSKASMNACIEIGGV